MERNSPVQSMISSFIMTPYAWKKLLAAWSKKLAVPLVMTATKNGFLFIKIRGTLTGEFLHIVCSSNLRIR